MLLKIIQRLVIAASAVCLVEAMAAEQAPAEEPKAAQLPPGADVSIEPAEKEVINEFRINGQLYMICINPKKGSTYCLVDADGDGNLETRKNDLTPDFLIPSWVLMRW